MLFYSLFCYYVQINGFSQNLGRNDVEQKYKWNLTDLYSSKEDWAKAKDETENKVNDIAKYKDKLDESASNLLYTLKLISILIKSFQEYMNTQMIQGIRI